MQNGKEMNRYVEILIIWYKQTNAAKFKMHVLVWWAPRLEEVAWKIKSAKM